MQTNDRFLEFDEVERAMLFRAMFARRMSALNEFKQIVSKKGYDRKRAAKICAEAATLQLLTMEIAQPLLLDEKTLKLLEPTEQEKVFFEVQSELQARRLS